MAWFEILSNEKGYHVFWNPLVPGMERLRLPSPGERKDGGGSIFGPLPADGDIDFLDGLSFGADEFWSADWIATRIEGDAGPVGCWEESRAPGSNTTGLLFKKASVVCRKKDSIQLVKLVMKSVRIVCTFAESSY